MSAPAMTGTDWNEAERLWRSSAALDDKLAMVERALAALARGETNESRDFCAVQGRDDGRKK